MAVSPALLLATLLFLLTLNKSESENSCTNQQDRPLICDLRETKLRVARLESVLEDSMHELNVKSQHLGECTKLIEEITHEIDYLQSVLLILKDDSSDANNRLASLEEEVQILWDISRRNNFDLHSLEFKAQDAEKRLDVVTSRAQTMADIVTEQWIQVQQLEQALQMAQMRTLKVKWQLRFTRCTFFKFIKNLLGDHLNPYLYDNWSAHESYLSQAMHQMKRIFAAAKYQHHQLQGYIKEEMEKNEFTASFANKEVVFFMASALITFPILSAWMFLAS